MKDLFKTIAVAIYVIALVVSCSNENFGTTTKESEKEKAKVDYQLNMYKMIAETKIIETSTNDKNWENAEISSYNYWYNPMIEDSPAYIEFKVTKDGKDAGYVMVSTTEQDFEVPEYCTEGKTMYEMLQAKAGTTEITATRFNSFDYMAEVSSGRGVSKKVFFGGISDFNNQGGRGNNDYEEYLAKYKELRSKIGGIGGCKEELEKYYEMKKEEKEAKGRGNASLYTDMYTYINREDLLPKYDQFDYKGGASGCTPTAAAEILAYWHRYHGRTNFFDKAPALKDTEMTDNEKSVILRLGSSKYMKTKYQNKEGTTNSYDAWDGLYRYIYDHGYNHWCIRYYWVDHNSDEAKYGYVNTFADWNNIFAEIKADHPAILFYHESSGSGHSAVIINVKIKRNSTTGFVNDVECKVEYGWGDYPRKTIYAGSKIFNEVLTCKIW